MGSGLKGELAIEGLHRQGRPRAKPYRTRPSKLGLRPGFDAVRLNQLADELEVDGRLESEAASVFVGLGSGATAPSP